LLVACLLAGCTKQQDFIAPPPPEVQVARPLRQSVTYYVEETGTTEAVQQVDVRARVRGFIDQVKFEPFTDVAAGDVLFVIEPRQYEAAVDGSKANVDASQVAVDRAKIEYERQQQLFQQNATPERNLVAAKAEYDGALAALEAAKAELNRAELDLEYTQVRTPIAGRVGRALVKQGNLVDGAEATQLTTVVNYDQIYANFFISERQLLLLGQDPKREGLRRSPTLEDKQAIKMELARETDEGFPYEGHFDSAELAVDQSTGTYRIRGVFANPNKDILPGLFVRVRVPMGVLEDALLVPEYAFSSDQSGQFLLVVNSQDVVERRSVSTGAPQTIGTTPFLVVDSGLRDDDRVVVNGLQRARPGAPVAPQLVNLQPAE
jgi:RND family efflux transporter MFP subunit